MYQYRLYPSKNQKERIINSFKTCKSIYNELLALNIDSWKFGKVSLNGFDCNKYLSGKYSSIHSQVKQNVSDRVHKAFQNFFRRVKDKSCKGKGFPRFKSRINSITFPQSGFKFVNERRLYASKIGNIPIVLHRVPRGKIKTLTIKVNKAWQWFACFSCELPDVKVVHPSKEKVGIDVNSRDNICFLSNGESFDNPKFLIKSEKKLKRLHKQLSRKKKGSKNRSKARFRLSRQYVKVTNQRTDFLHKLSRSLTTRYGIIAVEDLNIKSMISDSYNSKFIHDASWGTFINMLSYKAINVGGQLLKNPKTRGSSHRCNKCGFYVEDMPLSRKIFKCPECLNVCHRDLNASNNHLKDTVGLTEISTPVDIEPLPSKLKASSVVESGTTYGK